MSVFRLPAFVALPSAVILCQLCLAASVSAQFVYVSQAQSVSATATSYSTWQLPSTDPAVNYYFLTDGVTNFDRLTSDPSDFGLFHPTVSASATFSNNTSTVHGALQSSLDTDGIRMLVNYDMSRQGQMNRTLKNNEDSVEGRAQVEFTLMDITTVELLSNTGFFHTSVQLENLITGQKSNWGNPWEGFSNDNSKTVTLTPGHYTLTASLEKSIAQAGYGSPQVGTISLSMLSVPEPSTWIMMCAGLLAVTVGAARQRQQLA